MRLVKIRLSRLEETSPMLGEPCLIKIDAKVNHECGGTDSVFNKIGFSQDWPKSHVLLYSQFYEA